MKGFFFIVGLIIAGMLAYAFVPRMAQVIENDVTENVTATLIPQGLPADVQIKVEGRDVSLTGEVTSAEEKKKFADLALQAKGVRLVQDNLLVDESLSMVEIENQQTQSDIESEVNFDGDISSSDPFGEIVDEDMIVFDPLDEEPLFDFSDEEGLGDLEEPETVEPVAEVADVADIVIEDVVETMAPEETPAESTEPLSDALQPVEAEIEEVAEAVEPAKPEEKIDDVAVSETTEEPEQEAKKSSAECQAEISALVVGKKVNFETGVSKIEKESLPLLDSIAKAMAGCSDMAIHIHGHTDNQGDAELNRKLSHARAKSVGLYLLKQGVTQRIKIFGHGADQPIADNETEEGRMANRRIEFTVSDLDESLATDDSDTVKTIKTLRSIQPRAIIAD